MAANELFVKTNLYPANVKDLLSPMNLYVRDLSIRSIRSDPCKELVQFYNIAGSNCTGVKVLLARHIGSIKLLKDTCATHKNLSSTPFTPAHAVVLILSQAREPTFCIRGFRVLFLSLKIT